MVADTISQILIQSQLHHILVDAVLSPSLRSLPFKLNSLVCNSVQ